MKEATGELSMTVVTIIAIVAIAAIVALLKDPIADYIEGKWGELTGNDNIQLNG